LKNQTGVLASKNIRQFGCYKNYNYYNPYHNEKDPYDILGLKRDASLEQIKEAFHKNAKEYHPDKNAN